MKGGRPEFHSSNLDEANGDSQYTAVLWWSVRTADFQRHLDRLPAHQFLRQGEGYVYRFVSNIDRAQRLAVDSHAQTKRPVGQELGRADPQNVQRLTGGLGATQADTRLF